jgi:hypothetical protein
LFAGKELQNPQRDGCQVDDADSPRRRSAGMPRVPGKM